MDSELLFRTPLWSWCSNATHVMPTTEGVASAAEADLCRLASSCLSEQSALAASVEALRLFLAELPKGPSEDVHAREAHLSAVSADVETAFALKIAALETEAVTVDGALEALQTELRIARDGHRMGRDTSSLDSARATKRIEALFDRLRSLPCAPLEPTVLHLVPAEPGEPPWRIRLFAPRALAPSDVQLLPSLPVRVKIGAPLRLSCALTDECVASIAVAGSLEERADVAALLSRHLCVVGTWVRKGGVSARSLW
jgi:hypothetical protein